MLVDFDALPEDFPTHRHEAVFWEKLGRTVATFGFLEEVLGKSIYAFTVRKQHAASESDEAFEAWLRKPEGLEQALTDPLTGLIGQLARAVEEYSNERSGGLEDLIGQLREASRLRNVLCHGSWRSPDETGASKLLFVDRRHVVFESAIECGFLDQIRQHVVELACAVVNLVTNMGWQFPGSLGPGRPVLNR